MAPREGSSKGRRRRSPWRWPLRIVGGLVGLFVIAVVGALVLVHVIDWNAYKPRIAAAVREATGRELTLETVDLSLFPKIRLTLTAVSLSNAPWAGTPEMASAERISGVIGLWPLLVGRLAIDIFIVDRPRLNLEINAAGEANWTFRPDDAAAKDDGPSGDGDGGSGREVDLPFDTVTLGDVRLSDGAATYIDRPAGQTVEATEINATAALPTFADTLTASMTMLLNGEAVAFDGVVDSPRGLLEGDGAETSLDLTAPLIAASYAGGARTRPLPGLDGRFRLDIPSVGALAAWLGRPLPGRDPGPLRARASFAASSQRVAVEEATLEGTDLTARATGAVDIAGPVTKVTASVQSGIIDVDRYLPPRTAAPATKGDAAAAREAAETDTDNGALAALSDEPLDFDAVRDLDADVTVKIDGVKVRGFEVGRIDFAATAKDGIVSLLLNQLALYGGVVNSDTRLDAAGETPRATTETRIAGVDVGALARAAASGEPPVAGRLVATADFEATGASPRALVRSLAGRLTADLGGIDVAAAPLSALKASATLQGAEAPPVIEASGTYNRQALTVTVTTDPLRKLLGAERFNGEVTVAGDAVRGRGSGWLDTGPEVPEFDLTATIDKADLNALLPRKSGAAEGGQPAPGGETEGGADGESGWSTQPIDFSGLGRANGRAAIDFADITYKELVVTRGKATATLQDRVLSAELDDVRVAEGSIAAKAGIDATEDAAAVSYRTTIANIEARPLLGGLDITDRLGGTLVFNTQGEAKGRSEKELVETLNGVGGFRFSDGAIFGADLAKALRKARSLGLRRSAGSEKTDFAELSGTFEITDGVLVNRDLLMLSPVVRVTGAGQVPLPQRSVDYRAEARLLVTAGSRRGENALAGVPIPIRIIGGWDNPRVSVNWKGVFRSVDPDDLADLPGDLKQRAEELGVEVPGVDRLPDVESVPEKARDKAKDLFQKFFKN